MGITDDLIERIDALLDESRCGIPGHDCTMAYTCIIAELVAGEAAEDAADDGFGWGDAMVWTADRT